ncbi:unnamed protein product [Chondrus crispus]|uniref:Uncharacterized protein n=1 Tax=Chondrus crispus TaxID=2769 RepID=R7QK98_CHOCR|nr:unnamed protein product [Chondrus crispus]CDF37830.1 unnamed protein product [Chondrus crispus]|eukprot:XP_005717701.1 unnamed protein product [Chondrus crispus]
MTFTFPYLLKWVCSWHAYQGLRVKRSARKCKSNQHEMLSRRLFLLFNAAKYPYFCVLLLVPALFISLHGLRLLSCIRCSSASVPSHYYASRSPHCEGCSLAFNRNYQANPPPPPPTHAYCMHACLNSRSFAISLLSALFNRVYVPHSATTADNVSPGSIISRGTSKTFTRANVPGHCVPHCLSPKTKSW